MTVEEILQTMAYGPAPEADDKAVEWLKRHQGAFKLFVGGKWVAPKSGESFEVKNPANGELLARVAQAGSDDVNAAVDAASKAFKGWSKLSSHARARYLYALAREIQKAARGGAGGYRLSECFDLLPRELAHVPVARDTHLGKRD